jgi:hypothetical protein
MCQEREADLLVSLTSSGDTVFLCLVCTPFWVQALFETAGLPSLVFEMADQAAGEVEEAASGPSGAVEPRNAGTPTPDVFDDDWGPSGGSEAAPVGPGLLEQMDRDGDRLPVKPNGSRGRQKAPAGAVEGGRVEEDASDASDVQR